MTNSGYTIKVPGKLFIAGEYAVLEPEQMAVVIAVNRYVYAYIKSSVNNILDIPKTDMVNITWEIGCEDLIFNTTDNRLNFIKNSLLLVYRYLSEKSITHKNFHLVVESKLDDDESGKKYGLGSSAAVVTAVIAAVLQLHLGKLEKEDLDIIFKLASLAHVKTQGSGSGADIAAAVYGGWIHYSAFSTKWLLKQLDNDYKLTDVVEQPWTNLMIRKLIPPPMLQLAVGWTQETSATGPMIEKVQKFRESNEEIYKEFLIESSKAVDLLVKAFESKDYYQAMKALKKNGKALAKLGRSAGVSIVTSKLKKLCSTADRFGAGKSSGAGGGDCGIVFLKSNDLRDQLYMAWQEVDIIPLNLSVTEKGVVVEGITKV
ncbi:phosphomevalonate kinase [Clostridium thermarum]|uniref:phosphomevalonate kinase n=1 Tax=Clostridium thermarum TaxID=1716543 RepID=UPI0013D05A41|nr:phosphomevalonate kinase [Clostridium thermarum]